MTMPAPFLSIVIITYNEAENIAACIQSVQQVADEVIVVDSLSSDDTVKIAEGLGAKIILQPFAGYVEQKNIALAHARYAYVLSLDADERLDAAAIAQVLKEKQDGFPADGYIFKRCTYVGSRPVKHGSWYPDKKLRLVKKEMAAWKGINPHDTLTVASANIKTLQGNILHFSYKNETELLEKTKKYADISARHLFSLGKKVSPAMIPLKALARFFKHYVVKMGFLEGRLGWQIGKQQYYEAYWKYTGLAGLYKKK